MNFELKKPIKTPEGLLIRAISGESDGSIAVTYDGEELASAVRFYDAQGEVMYPMSPEERSGLLKKAYRQAFGDYVSDFASGYFTEEKFPNGWADVKVNRHRMLVNDEFKPIVTDYSMVRVTNCGIIIADGTLGSEKKFEFLNLKGQRLHTVKGIICFLGDGCYLADDPCTGKWFLCDFAGHRLTNKPITGCQMFANGSFILTTNDGFKRLYAPDGTPITIEVANESQIMPDGYVINYSECHLIDGIYSPKGILDNRSVYSFERMDNYYLITGEDVTGALYDSAGEYLGKNFKRLSSCDNFALFERGDTLFIFNQFGKVLSGKYVEG